MIQTIFSHPQIIGLILDIIGAFYIAKSFVFKNVKDMVAESWGTDYPDKNLISGMSGNLFRSFYRQATEAKIGFVIIALGFLSQIIALLKPSLEINYWLGFLIISTALITPLVIFKILFRPNRLDNIEIKTDKELSKRYEK